MATEFFPNAIDFLSTINVTGTLSANNFESPDSPKWNSVYSNVQSNSATYATSSFVQSNFLPLSGGSVSGVFEIGSGSTTLFVSSGIVGVNTELPNEALTVVGNISSTGIIYASGGNSNQWNSSSTIVQANSAAWSAAVVYIHRFDYVPDGIDYSYSGVASEETLESDPFWKITRLVFNDVGALSATGVAQNVTWNERLTATYI